MAIVETTRRPVPCDKPNEADTLATHWKAAKASGSMLRVENKGKSEYLNPDHVVGITDGTND
jgi:hypothetical protein